MKKVNAILLLSLFLTAQYAKQLSYLGCQLYKVSATAGFNCDCEKIFDEKNNTAAEPVQHASHKHVQTTDYEQPGLASKLTLPQLFAELIFPMNNSNTVSDGFLNQIQKPPQA